MGFHYVPKAVFAEDLFGRVLRLDDSVRKEDQGVTRAPWPFHGFEGRVGVDPQQGAGGLQGFGRARVRAVVKRKVMAGVSVGVPPRVRIDHQVAGRHEQPVGNGRLYDPVEGVHDRRDVRVDTGLGGPAAAGHGHDQARVEPVAGDVPDQQADPPVGQREVVVVVAPHVLGRTAVAGELHAGVVQVLLRQHGTLDLVGALDVLLEALVRLDLFLGRLELFQVTRLQRPVDGRDQEAGGVVGDPARLFHVAEGARLHALHDVGLGPVRGQHDAFRRRLQGPDAPDRFESAFPVRFDPHVDHRHVDGAAGVADPVHALVHAGGADHVEIRFQVEGNGVGDRGVVVEEEYESFGHNRLSSPGAERR